MHGRPDCRLYTVDDWADILMSVVVFYCYSCVPEVRIAEIHPQGRYIKLENTSKTQVSFFHQSIVRCFYAAFVYYVAPLRISSVCQLVACTYCTSNARKESRRRFKFCWKVSFIDLQFWCHKHYLIWNSEYFKKELNLFLICAHCKQAEMITLINGYNLFIIL